MKLFNDKNISALIRQKPKYILIVFIKSLVAIYKRKNNIYSKLKNSSHLLNKFKINLEKIEISFGNENFWRDEFIKKDNQNTNWSVKRNYKLRDFFYVLTKSRYIKNNPTDKEEYWSAMQLNWLFFFVRNEETICEKANSIISAASCLMNNNKNHWIYRQFTVSEMITNIVKIQLYYGKNFKIDKQSEEFIKDGIEFILNNLEIYQKSNKISLNHTNNHILSNIRALFWSTKFFRDSNLKNFAIKIFEKNCVNLFQDGTLDEGSSIYHFIAAQCIYDISFFVNFDKLPRVDKFILFLQEADLLNEPNFPVVGDVSPDPNMGTVIDDALKISNILSKGKLDTEQISDYEIFKHKNWSFFIHSRKQNKHIQHSHNDYGSPVINYKKNNIIFDLGRPTYAKINKSGDFTSTEFHNVPQIDRLDQSPRARRDIYPYKFLIPEVTDNINVVSDKFRNTNKYTTLYKKNFKLFPNHIFGGSWDRSFVCNKIDDCIIYIEDYLTLNFFKSVVFRFFVPQNIINDSIASYEFYKNGEIIAHKQKEVICNSSYGEVKKAYLFEIQSESSKDHQLLTKIIINDE